MDWAKKYAVTVEESNNFAADFALRSLLLPVRQENY